MVSEYKHVSEGRNIVLKNFFCSDKLQFRKKLQQNFEEHVSQREETILQSEGKYNLQFHFVGEIFPPYKCTHGPAEDPVEAVMCTVGLPLKSHVAY